MTRRIWFLASTVVTIAIMVVFPFVTAGEETISRSENCTGDQIVCDDAPDVTVSKSMWQEYGWRPVLTLVPLVLLSIAATVYPATLLGAAALIAGVLTSYAMASLFFILLPSIALLAAGLVLPPPRTRGEPRIAVARQPARGDGAT